MKVAAEAADRSLRFVGYRLYAFTRRNDDQQSVKARG